MLVSDERLGKHVTRKPSIVHSNALCDIQSRKLYNFVNIIFKENVKKGNDNITKHFSYITGTDESK